MPIQVDFLPVGSGAKSGDAIAIRYGDTLTAATQRVIVIDGGYQDAGEALVKHIVSEYGTYIVDLVVSTHPDADHSSGLEKVLTDLVVGELWLHRPWLHTTDIAKMFVDGRVTDQSVAAGIRKSLEDARALETIALKKNIPIVEPFLGVVDKSSALAVLSPSKSFYESLLPEFRCTPQAKDSFLKYLLEAAKAAALNLVEEVWHVELLSDPPKGTHAENESATVLLFAWDAQYILFTSDAGHVALESAVNVLHEINISPSKLTLLQVPHHGSKRNVGPWILDQLLGPKLPFDGTVRDAVVSASPGGAPKHPSKQVLNAFRRRGCRVFGTVHGGHFCWHYKAPRPNWAQATPLPFYTEVEE
jgi:beta-lactamase superfamily II metal-dependent hydrolase